MTNIHNLHVWVPKKLFTRFLKLLKRRGQKITEAVAEAINLYMERHENGND